MTFGNTHATPFLICTLLLAFTVQTKAQERREIETDRDSFTPALATVERGRFMVEASYSFIDNRNAAETHSLPELLLRHGLTENIELRFGANYEVGGEPNATSSGGGSFLEEGELERESKVIYGFKALLTEQDGWVPQSNVTIMGNTPTSGPETASRLIIGNTFGWVLANDWQWATAIRYSTAREEEDNFNNWAPSTVIKIPVGERLAVHAEYFGLISDGRENEFSKHFFSPGIHYLVTRDLEVGLRTGWGLNHESANFFSNIGFGWQY